MRLTARAFVLAILALTPVVGAAQVGSGYGPGNSTSANNPTYPLDGIVVNAVTGEPIRRALVQSSPAGAQLTGADGKFHFASVPGGNYNIHASKPGYFSDQELSPGAYRNSAIQVGPNMPAVTMKLTPEGVITGRITGANGEPLENLPVRVFVSRVENGQKRWGQQGGRSTDDEGHFRIAELRPGTYYLKVGPGFQNVSLPGVNPSQRREGYSATFYPAGRDLDAAAPIKVEAGQEYRAEFAIPVVPFYQVSGSVTGTPPGAQGVNFQIVTRDGDGVGSGVRYNSQTGTFSADAIPAGSYVLVAFSQPPTGADRAARQMWTARMPLTVTGDLAGVTLVLAPPITIPVTVRNEGTKTNLPEGSILANVSLMPRDPGFLNGGAAGNFEGPQGSQTFAVRNVQPGIYRAQITPTGSWYVDSARSGNVDLLREDFNIPYGASVDPIEIVVRDDSASLRGSVTSTGQAAPGMVVLIPAATPRLARLVYVQADGTFNIGILAPGDYRVVALDRADDLEFTNPDAMQEFSSAMQTIHLAANQQAVVNLELRSRQK